MFKISHEVPISLLKESIFFNDYDYFLIHLCKKYKEYMDFYSYCKNMGRYIILDNSACELRGKEEFNFDEFANEVRNLEPDEYLIPDVFNNYEKNIQYFNKWMEKYIDLKGVKIATLHGSNIDEMIKSYEYFKKFDVKIAFNFDEIVYTQQNFSDNISLNKMLNRKYVIEKFVKDSIIDSNKKHHLLGCHLPQEFAYYVNYDWIESIDTSNPVISSFVNEKYNGIQGLCNKPKSNIDLVQNITLNDDIMKNLWYNLYYFKKICGR